MSIYLLIWGFLISHSLASDLIISLPNGKIEGTEFDTEGKTFYAWRGIPYAAPPVKGLRFMPPQPPQSWTGIRNASKDGASCLFDVHYRGDPIPESQSEDCLFVNVYSPTKNTSANLPVLVWIYGGGFVSGFAAFNFYDPAPLLNENVIVVTFNYRLGPFGFLSTEDDVISGNAGLKDQNMALKWTNRTIALFGGNPSEITIFGESAGGISVGFHMMSPLSKNLFRAAISESGTALNGLFQSNAREFAYNLTSSIDPSVTAETSTKEIRKILQNAPPQAILDATTQSGYQCAAVLEKGSSENAFLTQPLYESLITGKTNLVPYIAGHNSEESIGFVRDLESAQNQARYFDQNSQLLVPTMNLKDEASRREIGEKILTHYAGKNGSFEDNLANMFHWWSDNMFIRGTYKQVAIQSRFTPVYLYQFSYYGSRSKNHIIIPGAGKVGHAEEVGYLFNISTSPLETEADFLARRRLAKLWTNFAKTLNPTPEDDASDLLQNVKWEPLTEDNIRYLDVGDDLKIMPNRRVEDMEFWNYIWDTYSYHPYNTF